MKPLSEVVERWEPINIIVETTLRHTNPVYDVRVITRLRKK